MKNLFFTCLVAVFLGQNAMANFVDEVESSGIDFVHFNGMSGEFYFHEMMGSGVALFDYDNDGDLDVYFSQGKMIGDKAIAKAIFQPRHKMPLGDRLYRNDSTLGVLKFTDVTEESKIKAYGYGMGVTTADIDNDGDIDIYLSNFGKNQMWLNNGDGTFSDVTAKSLTDNDGWSVAATFFDYDKDGYLDLYVVNYVDFNISNTVKCRSYDGALDYCSPQVYKAIRDSLFHNNKDGTFTNMTSKSGVVKETQPGLGVVAADFNNDGWMDLYVANDGMPNILWMNNQRGGFVNKAMLSGVAVNMTGVAEASMGVDAADFDNDGDIDLFMTHLNRQTNTLYVNNGKAWFSDAGVRMGVASSSFRSTGFGTKWFDYDNDGYLDLFSANGAVIKEPKQVESRSKFPLKQVNQLWHNQGNGKYKEVSRQQDATFLRPGVSRGAAFGDIDNDGDLDIIVTNNADVPHVLINKSENKNNWIGFKLVDKKNNRVDYGAKVEASWTDRKIFRQVKTDGSYASAHDSRVLVGLGASPARPAVKVIWSDGKEQELTRIQLNAYQTIYRDK